MSTEVSCRDGDHECILYVSAMMIVSNARREDLEAIHQRVVTKNMVLRGLRGIPTTDELTILSGRKSETHR